MNVLALDLGTNTGYALNQGNTFYCGTWKLATAKEIREFGKTRMNRRCDPRVRQLYENVYRIAALDLIIFEDVLFCSTTYQCQLWASLRAAVWLSGRSPSVVVDCLPVQTLKQHATGRGNATKEQMIFAARTQRPDLKFDDNSADAFHLWTWAQKHIKL